jgi:hypothetical protein
MSHPRHRRAVAVHHQSMVMMAYLDVAKILGAMIGRAGAAAKRSYEGEVVNCRQLRPGARKARELDSGQSRKLLPSDGRCGGRLGACCCSRSRSRLGPGCSMPASIQMRPRPVVPPKRLRPRRQGTSGDKPLYLLSSRHSGDVESRLCSGAGYALSKSDAGFIGRDAAPP